MDEPFLANPGVQIVFVACSMIFAIIVIIFY